MSELQLGDRKPPPASWSLLTPKFGAARRWFFPCPPSPAHSVSCYLTWCGGRGPRTRSRPRSRGYRYRRVRRQIRIRSFMAPPRRRAAHFLIVEGLARRAQVVNERYPKTFQVQNHWKSVWGGGGSTRCALSFLLPSPLLPLSPL
jgi:hypothetical protein